MKIIFVIVVFITLFPNFASAQTGSTQQFGVSPFLEELEVAKGGTIESSITITNLTNEKLDLQISTQDFIPGDRGEALFIPDNEINEATFSLASWISLKNGSTLTIEAGKDAVVEYIVNPPANAEEGTHYGAILFSNTHGSSLAGVDIKQSVGTIILVSYGQARPSGEVEYSVNKNVQWWSGGFEFTNKFINTGNVHVKPKGEVVVKNILGQVVATPQLNKDASNVLPKSERTFLTSWLPENWRFGRYSAELNIIYGREKLEIRETVVVWMLPMYICIPLMTVLSFIIWFIFHGRHLHRRRVVRKHLERTKI